MSDDNNLYARAELTPQMLARAARKLEQLHPNARLLKNEVGNLAILNEAGEYLGFVNLRDGEVDLAAEAGGSTP